MRVSRGVRGAEGRAALGPERLWHPALDQGFHAAAGRSPLNLRDEAEVARFAIAAFSLLAFLDLEDGPLRPEPSEWLLGPDGLPRWKPQGGRAGGGSTPRDHARFVYRLLGGRTSPDGRPWPSVPRRHQGFAHWNRWFARVQREDAPIPSCRDLALGLWDVWSRRGLDGAPPSSWGFGSVWEERGAWGPGLQTFSARGGPATGVALDMARRPPQGLPPLRPISLGTPPPYPYASLEPLVEQALGQQGGEREWLGRRLAEGRAALELALARLLSRAEGAGWLLWPSEALDGDARRTLEAACAGLAIPVVLLAGDGDAPPLAEVKRVRCLWLPERAEEWYRRHSRSLLGDDHRSLLSLSELLAPGQPRCGGSLVPPVPPGPRHPATPWLGEGHGAEGRPRKRPSGAAALNEALHNGRYAEVAFTVRDLEARGEPSSARFWRGRLLLEIGQPRLALDALGAPAGSELEPGGRLHQARALERLKDFDGARRALGAVDKRALEPQERAQATLLEGQLLWLEGDAASAEARFDEVLHASPSPDATAQALCHKATLAMHTDHPLRAGQLLDEAQRVAPEPPRPLTRFILLHRRAMALRKEGRFVEALEAFEAARAWAAAFALRDLEAWSACERGNVLRRLHRFEEAVVELGRALQGAEALGLGTLEESARFDLAVCQVEAGDLREARGVFEGSLAREGARENPVHRAVDHYWLAAVSAQLGDVPRALELCEKGLEALGDLRDVEVRVPLLVLRGELLLSTGQLRRVAHVLETLEALAGPGTETDDLLAAAALRRAAAASGCGRFSERDLRQARDLLPKADPYFRAYWHLLSARAVEYGADEELRLAWQQAQEARSPHLACRALWALAERKSLPPLDRDTGAWLVAFLGKNGVRGPERGLLSLLAEGEGRAAVSEEQPSDEVAFLGAAERDPDASLEGVLPLLGCHCACLVVPGRPPSWWGVSSAAQRQALAGAAGRRGRFRLFQGEILGVGGAEGIWCGLLRASGPPFSDREEGLARVWARLLRAAPASPGEAPAADVDPAISRELLTRSPAMAPVLEALHRAAAFEFPVLLTGEPGVGKEACARALHGASSRGRREWVPFNCANLSPTLAASQLFGHRRGAFTGADRDHAGLVEAARGTTLFLDEVGELPPDVQPQVLRFLQGGDFLPLGETRPRRSDARIVSATNRDLVACGEDGRFRKDLYHRLNVISIEIPPLRRRPEDIPLLFGHFLGQVAREASVPEPGVDPVVLGRLSVYPWPGNVRELQNVAKALLVASHRSGAIHEGHLPPHLRDGGHPGAGGATLADQLAVAEREAIRSALRGAGGSPSAAARALGISRQSLHQKMKRLRIGSPSASP